MTDPARHRRAMELFLAAGERPLDERAAFLDAECGSDHALRTTVEDMLSAERARPGFLDDSPVPRVAPAGWSPDRVGAFRIVRSLGEGGMGRVFEAEQENPRRRVALKVLRLGFASPRLLQRFEVEKTVLARLHHPGIAQIYEAGTAELFGSTQPYFAMEFVDGLPLTTYVLSHELPTRARLELFVRICDAVQHAHQQAVIHRDLKPANIVVTTDGQPKVLDFGIARVSDADVQLTRSTDAKQILGTLPYMSPEQAAGLPEQVDVRSDVYGLGVILYELLTDCLPYDVTKTPLPEAVRIICEQEPRPLSAIRRKLRGDLETVAGKALQKHKERRYASADALAADVRRYLRDEPIEARRAGGLYKLVKLARRNKLRVAALAVVLALLAGLWITTRAAMEEARRRAQSERRLYHDAVGVAATEIDAGDVGAARRRLDAAAPELRDWEWRYLYERLDPGVRLLTGAPRAPYYVGVVRATNQALSVDANSTVSLWDLTTGELTERRFADQAMPGTESHFPLASSSDGSLVLTRSTLRRGDDESTFATLWETTTGRRIVERFPVDDVALPNLGVAAISPTGTHVTLGAEDALYLYEVRETGPERPASVRLVERFEPTPAACTFDARGEWLVYAAGSMVRFFGVLEDREVRDAVDATGQPDRNVGELALSPDRRFLATSFGSSIHVLDLESGASLEFPSRGGQVYDLVFGAVTPVLLCLADGAIQLWDARTGVEVRAFPSYTRYGPSSVFDATDRWLVTAHSGMHLPSERKEEFGIKIWDLDHDRGLVLRGHEGPVSAVAVNRDGSVLASGSSDGEVRVWDAETGLWRSTLARGLPAIDALAFDAGGVRLFVATRRVGGPGGSRAVWDIATGERLEQIDLRSTVDASTIGQREVLPAHDGVVAVAAEGSFVAVAKRGFDTKTIEVWLTSPPERAFVLESPSGVTALGVSPDGSRLLSGDRAGDLTIWDLASRRRLSTTRAHAGGVFALTFLNDRRIASGGGDDVIRIWDADATRAPEQLVELRGHGDAVHALVLAPDGERLISGSADGTVRVW